MAAEETDATGHADLAKVGSRGLEKQMSQNPWFGWNTVRTWMKEPLRTSVQWNLWEVLEQEFVIMDVKVVSLQQQSVWQ